MVFLARNQSLTTSQADAVAVVERRDRQEPLIRTDYICCQQLYKVDQPLKRSALLTDQESRLS